MNNFQSIVKEEEKEISDNSDQGNIQKNKQRRRN